MADEEPTESLHGWFRLVKSLGLDARLFRSPPQHMLMSWSQTYDAYFRVLVTAAVVVKIINAADLARPWQANIAPPAGTEGNLCGLRNYWLADL